MSKLKNVDRVRVETISCGKMPAIFILVVESTLRRGNRNRKGGAAWFLIGWRRPMASIRSKHVIYLIQSKCNGANFAFSDAVFEGNKGSPCMNEWVEVMASVSFTGRRRRRHVTWPINTPPNLEPRPLLPYAFPLSWFSSRLLLPVKKPAPVAANQMPESPKNHHRASTINANEQTISFFLSFFLFLVWFSC